jgi:hypothetical protein
MAVSYELMDLDSGNLVGSYRTLGEALAVIRDSYVLYGWSGVNDLGLVKVAGHDSQELVAVGPELARMAIADANSAANGRGRQRTA